MVSMHFSETATFPKEFVSAHPEMEKKNLLFWLSLGWELPLQFFLGAASPGDESSRPAGSKELFFFTGSAFHMS